MLGQIQIARMQRDWAADRMGQHRRFTVVDHHLGGGATKVGKAILMAGQEVFHGLSQRELNVKAAAERQHHDKETQSSACRLQR